MFSKFIACRAIFLIIFINHCKCNDEETCDRRPLGVKSEPLAPDNQFYIEINGIIDNLYIPQLRLQSRDGTATFIAFTISLKEDTKENRANLRRPISLNPGQLERIQNSTNTKKSYTCKNTIVESDITPKTSVEAVWKAPEKDNKCVTIFAVVAVEQNVWYNFEGPLSRRVCEDTRKVEDMLPLENNDCLACEDARYQMTFQGLWSYNTHSQMFPLKRELGRFSDIVGASHSKDYNLYKYTSVASLGLKMLAEQGNTTRLEIEIHEMLGKTVRTIIKATAPKETNMDTVASFRASKEHHLMSLVTGLLPSPDWFLGVANLELCDVKTNNWAQSIIFNLYPMDAGTDKGTTFQAANEELSPPLPISPIVLSNDMKPFAKLRLDLVRTYYKPDCNINSTVEETTEENDNEVDYSKEYNGNAGESETSIVQTTTSELPPSVDPESTVDCPTTTWEEWLTCEGECVDGTIKGFQIRFRYHMVDGEVIGKYVEGGPSNEEKEVPKYCSDEFPTSETRECQESCEEEEPEKEDEAIEATAQRRIWWR